MQQPPNTSITGDHQLDPKSNMRAKIVIPAAGSGGSAAAAAAGAAESGFGMLSRRMLVFDSLKSMWIDHGSQVDWESEDDSTYAVQRQRQVDRSLHASYEPKGEPYDQNLPS